MCSKDDIGRLNLPHRPKTKKWEKVELKSKNWCAQKYRQTVRGIRGVSELRQWAYKNKLSNDWDCYQCVWNSRQPPQTDAVGADTAAENDYELTGDTEYASVVRTSRFEDSTGNDEVAPSDHEPVSYSQIAAVQDRDLYANVWL